jgi:hypothetical protein
VPGWADVNAIVNLFAHEEASSNFVLDGEGHCAYIVPIEFKAWTQAGGNPFSVSVEVIDTGKESIYLAPAGLKQLRVIARWVNKQTGIPIRSAGSRAPARRSARLRPAQGLGGLRRRPRRHHAVQRPGDRQVPRGWRGRRRRRSGSGTARRSTSSTSPAARATTATRRVRLVVIAYLLVAALTHSFVLALIVALAVLVACLARSGRF